MPRLTQRGVRISALVPNLRGLDRAIAAGVREVAVFPAASETFSRRNLNQSVDEALKAAGEVCAVALAAGMRVRGYVSTAFGCPYEGNVPVAHVISVCEALLAHGVFEVAISDTIGVAHPGQVRALLRDMHTVGSTGPRGAAFPRHAWHGARECPRGARRAHHHVRCVCRRARRLPVRAREHSATSPPRT